MSDERDEWVRVESEDEPRPGMAVQLRPCKWCGRVETFSLIRRMGRLYGSLSPGFIIDDDDTDGWSTAGRCDGPESLATAVGIRDGRLYRLCDLPSEETTAATRRRVSVKAGR